MTILLVTTCTNRKLCAAPEVLQACNLPRGPQDEVARIWRRRVKSSTERGPALKLYCGRGFSEALATAGLSGNALWVISAGMGLIQAEEEIPPYDLTIAKGGPNSLRNRIVPWEFRADVWWLHINGLHCPERSLAWLVRSNPRATVVVTLSAAYAELIQADLLTLDEPSLNRVRIAGLASPEPLQSGLRHLLMPYDERLDGPESPLRGTRSDFAQRATRHFVELIMSTDPFASPERHRIQVLSALEGMPRPAIPERRRMSDDDLMDLIEQEWDRAGGSAARMLRILRDEEQVACEQGRFSNLFKCVKQRLSL